MYQCNHCDYKSRRTWCINRHSLKKHGSGRAPTTYRESGPDVGPAPTSIQVQHPHIVSNAYQPSNQAQIKQNGYGIQSHAYQAPTSHCASGP